MGGSSSYNLGLGTVCQGGLKGAIQEQVTKTDGVVTKLSQPRLRNSLAF